MTTTATDIYRVVCTGCGGVWMFEGWNRAVGFCQEHGTSGQRLEIYQVHVTTSENGASSAKTARRTRKARPARHVMSRTETPPA